MPAKAAAACLGDLGAVGDRCARGSRASVSRAPPIDVTP